MIASTSFSDARRACPTEQAPDAVLVGHLSAVDPGLDHQSLRVHEQVALPAADLLAAVEAPLLTADAGDLGRLRVEDAGTRLGISPKPHPQAFAHRAVEPLPGTIQAPFPEVVEHRFPGRELAREHPPLTTTLQDVEDGVKDLASTVQPRTSAPFRGRGVRLKLLPLLVGQVGGVFPLALHAVERS